MRRLALLATVASFAVPMLASAPASAQATRTWVSGVGDDANPCSRTAPCKTFSGAISKTAAGGEINCLDPGGFGGLTITKSLTVSCEGLTGGVLVSGTNAFIINAAATDRIYLKGLDFEGLVTGLNGIRVLSAGLVHVEDTMIRNFQGAAPNGFGIQFAPAAALTFVLNRVTLFNNGTGATGGGVQVRPIGGTTNGTITQVTMNRNVSGLVGDGFGGGAGYNVTMRDSAINGSPSNGILNTSTVVSSIMVHGSSISNNGNGVLSQNAGATTRVGSSAVSGNGTAFSGANSLSYGNNQVNGNGGGETPGLVPGGLK